MKLPFKVAAVAFVAACFVIVGGRILNADWSSKPPIEQIKKINNSISPSSNMEKTSSGPISKLTFIGYSTHYHSRASLDADVSFFESLASSSNWRLKEVTKTPAFYRAIYCSGNLAQDIEVRPTDRGSTIVIGTYWAADRGDPRYCR